MLDMNKIISEETERVMNSKQNRVINEEATKLANEEIDKRNNSKARTQLKQKDPVVAWLESQPEVQKVYLDDMGLIIGTDYNDNTTIHEVEAIEYKPNSDLDDFMKS